jgi:hypothetical protein
MPQLDKFAFSSQVFWLILLFLGGYFLFFNFILPSIYAVIKVRTTRFVNLWNRMNFYAWKKKDTIRFHKQFFQTFFEQQLQFLANLQRQIALSREHQWNFLVARVGTKQLLQFYHLFLRYTSFLSQVIRREGEQYGKK